MPKPPTVISERVDDIPLLIEQMRHMGLASLIDQHFVPHGNWEGLPPGPLSVLWLSFILSEGDHRLNQVETWVVDHRLTLQSCLAPSVRSLDASDDHLAHLLDLLGDDAAWVAFEQACAQTLMRTYALDSRTARVDTTTTSGYGQVTPDGIFHFGHSKDHRPDLPQVKINLATLDPLGLPLVTQVWPGQTGDDPLYIPAIQQVQAGLQQAGMTYIGDSKMGALATRAYVQHSHDYYLLPLGLVQLSAAEIDTRLTPVWRNQQSLTPVYRPPAHVGERREKIAEGFEWIERLTAAVDGLPCWWSERRFLLRSFSYATAQEKALRTQLAQAQHALEALNQRGRGHARYPRQAPLQEAVQALLTSHQVEGLLKVTYAAQRTTRSVRAYGTRPARRTQRTDYFVRVAINTPAVARAIRRLGWRVYATNHPKRTLSLAQAVDAYRHQYLEERGFGRLKGRLLALSPLYLSNAQRVTGLIRLLSLGLRVLTLVEFEVRRQLQLQHADLAGLYAGQPKRATVHPTTEQLLHAFKGLTLTIWRTGNVWQTHLPTLSLLQRRILKLLKFPAILYSRLERQSLELAPKMGEP